MIKRIPSATITAIENTFISIKGATKKIQIKAAIPATNTNAKLFFIL